MSLTSACACAASIPAEVAAERGERSDLAHGERRGVGRHEAEQRPDGHRHVVHQMSETIERFGIGLRVSSQLAASPVLVGPLGQVPAVRKRRDRALERQNLQAMPRQLQVPDDSSGRRRLTT